MDDLLDRPYINTQAYNYKKREETFIIDITHEEALRNAHELIKSERMAKLKAEKQGAKRKGQKEKEGMRKILNNGNMAKKTLSNSVQRLDSGLTAETNRTVSPDENGGQRLGDADRKDREDRSNNEFLDMDAPFVEVSIKRNKNIISNETSVSKSEKSISKTSAKFVRLKNTENRSDQALILGKQSCDFVLNDNDFDKAIDCLTQAISLAPDDVRHFLNRSYCYLRAGQYSLALIDAEFAFKNSQSPEHAAQAIARKGQALCGSQQYYEAEKCFAKILKLEQGNEWILAELTLARVFQLVNIGFSELNALKALQQCSGVNDAVALLVSGNINSPVLETDLRKSDIDNCSGDEIYYSDDETSSITLLSELVSTMKSEYRYLQNMRSQPVCSRLQECSNDLEGMSTGDQASIGSLFQSNNLGTSDNARWRSLNKRKSIRQNQTHSKTR